MKRREFLKTATGAAFVLLTPIEALVPPVEAESAAQVAVPDNYNPIPSNIESPDGPGGASAALQRLSISADGKTPVVKSFTNEWIIDLTKRGSPKIYSAENSADFAYIGMPIGGIGAGQVYLSGDGKLWWWDIFDTRASTWPNDQFNAYVSPYHQNDPNDRHQYIVEQGFTLRVGDKSSAFVRSLDKTGFANIEFSGQYPVATISYFDELLPVSVKLEAFSPFVPGDVDSSTLPATIFQYTVTNTSSAAVTGSITGHLENAVCIVSGAVGSPTRLNTVNVKPSYTEVKSSIETTAEAAVVVPQPTILFDDFEDGTYGNWTASGTAFGTRPAKAGEIFHSQAVRNEQGAYMADSFLSGNDNATGTLTSKDFVISRSYLNFLIGGGDHPGTTCMNLVVNGKIVRTATGQNSEALDWATWSVGSLKGQTAHLEIIDNESGDWGHIMVDAIEFSDTPRSNLEEVKAKRDFGTLSIASIGAPSNIFASAAVENADLLAPVLPSSVSSQSRIYDLTITDPLVGTATHRFTLAPKQSTTLSFVVAWNFPGPEDIGIRTPMSRGYSTRFADSSAVVDYISENFEQLTSHTKLWRDTWYNSTLPFWFLDRTFGNTSILATSTTHLLSDGRFYGYEGMYSCPGTCTHVWGYVQAMGRVFSALDKSILEHDHLMPGIGMNPDGGVGMRSEIDSTPAVDGQSDIVLRSYLAHQMTPDNSFLVKNYAQIKKALEYLRNFNDPNGTGTLIGSQHNTLDAQYFTRTAWLTLNYQAALLAMAEMAVDMGESDYATTLRQIQLKGRQYAETNLFNGEYFYQEKDPAYPNSTGTYDGCEYSQLVGQNWAQQVGCGPVVDPAKSIIALNSIWKYSYTTDVGPYTSKFGTGRPFVLPGEGGIIGCTWPRGNDSINVAYLNECQSGYEYACSAAMIWEGLVDKGLAHIRTVHDRYDGSKRNPWNEVEAGSHYSRSMASYGLFIAICGFEYHGPRGHMAFIPRLTPENFRAPFTAAMGWGTYAQRRSEIVQTHRLGVEYGEVQLRTFGVAVPTGVTAKTVTAAISAKPIKGVKLIQNGQRVTIVFPARITVAQGEHLEFSIV